MLVTRQNLDSVIEALSSTGERGLDCETTGLLEDDRLFSIICASVENIYYFNFNSNSLDSDYVLNRSVVCGLLASKVFSNVSSVWFIHNAKFDMRMLYHEGIEIKGQVICTQAIERVINNNYFGKEPYSLDSCAKRRGWAKDDAVKKYISKHRLYTKKQTPGKKKIIQIPHYDQVPFEIMAPYGEKDGDLHIKLGLLQREELKQLQLAGYPSLEKIAENEIQLTKTCFAMERRGIKLDKPYTAAALEYEIATINTLQKQFADLAREPFVDSNKTLARIFDAQGEVYPLTEKGNPSFAADALEEMTSPIANIVNKIRYHEKRAGTYYSSFIYYADAHDVIHADIRQAGTETGRMSYRDPNLQNIPKEDEEEDQATPYHVRSCFVPREGYFFYSVDYAQMEYRLLLDYAGETELIKQIMLGADVHQATADLLGIPRKYAKTLNFAILYGAGPARISRMLDITEVEATQLRYNYFRKLPKVRNLVHEVIRRGESRGWIFNYFGRRCHISSRDFAYILPNHLIQGSGADVVKFAMNKIAPILGNSHMLLQVHDEIIFEVPFGEEKIIEPIVHIMENVYKPQNGMSLTTSVEHSFKSWGYRDKIKGVPYGSGEANSHN
jgi:DNA polymerase I-like protein with 3'-5' exonuclease and polymerase domains